MAENDPTTICWSGGDTAHEVALELADDVIGTRVFDVTKLHEQEGDRVTVPAKTLFFAPDFMTNTTFPRRNPEEAVETADIPGTYLFFKPSSALLYGYLVSKHHRYQSGESTKTKRMIALRQFECGRTFTLTVPKEVPHLAKTSRKEAEKMDLDYERELFNNLVFKEGEYASGETKQPHEIELVRISLSRIVTVVRASPEKMKLETIAITEFPDESVEIHKEIAAELAHVAEKRSELEYDAKEMLSDNALLLAKRNNLDVVLHGRGDYRGRTEWQVMKAFSDNPEHVAMMYLMTFSDRDGVHVFTVTDAFKKRKRSKKRASTAAVAEPEKKKKSKGKEKKQDRPVPSSDMCPAHEKRRTLALVATYKPDNATDQRIVHGLTVKPRRPEAAEAVRMLVLHIVQAVCRPSRRLLFAMPISFTVDDQEILVNLGTRDKAWRARSPLHEGIASGEIGAEQIAQIAAKKHPTIRRRALKSQVFTPIVNGAPKAGLVEIWTPTATAIVAGNESALNGLLAYNPALATSTFTPLMRYNTPVSLAAAFDRPGMLGKIETFALVLLNMDSDKVRDRLYIKSVVEVAIQRNSEQVLQYFRSIRLPMYLKVRSSDPKLVKKLALQGDVAGFTDAVKELLGTGATLSFRTAAKIVSDMTRGGPPPSRFGQIVEIFDVLHGMQLLPVCPLSLYRSVEDMVSDRDPLAGDVHKQYDRLITEAETTSDLQRKQELEDRAKRLLHDRREAINNEISEARRRALSRLDAAMRTRTSDIADALVRHTLDDNARWLATEVAFEMLNTLLEDGVNHARVVGLLWDTWDKNNVADAKQMASKLIEFGAPTFFSEKQNNDDLPEEYVQWALREQAYYDGLHHYDSVLLDQIMPRYGVMPTAVPRESVTIIGANGDDSGSSGDDSDFGDDDESGLEEEEEEEESGSEGEEELSEEEEMEECARVVDIKVVHELIPEAWKAHGSEWVGKYTDAIKQGHAAGNRERLDRKRPLKRRLGVDDEPAEPPSDPKRQRVKHCIVCGAIARARCSRCKKAAYCSGDCQKQHWDAHSVSCMI